MSYTTKNWSHLFIRLRVHTNWHFREEYRPLIWEKTYRMCVSELGGICIANATKLGTGILFWGWNFDNNSPAKRQCYFDDQRSLCCILLQIMRLKSQPITETLHHMYSYSQYKRHAGGTLNSQTMEWLLWAFWAQNDRDRLGLAVWKLKTQRKTQAVMLPTFSSLAALHDNYGAVGDHKVGIMTTLEFNAYPIIARLSSLEAFTFGSYLVTWFIL